MTRRLSSSFILRPSDFSRLLDGQKRQQRPLLRPGSLHSKRVRTNLECGGNDAALDARDE